MTKLVLTREREDSKKFIEILKNQIFEVFFLSDNAQLFVDDLFLVAPMLEIRPIAFDAAALTATTEKTQGVILTSRHAVKALAQIKALSRSIPLYCVGQGVAEVATAEGYSTIELCAATASALAQGMIMRQPLKSRCFLYLRGRHVSFDFSDFLERQGAVLEEIIVYDSCPVIVFPLEIKELIRKNEVSAVAFFSARAAHTFIHLAEEAQLTQQIKTIKALCISPHVLKFTHHVFNDAFAADSPDINGMAALVRQHLGQGA